METHRATAKDHRMGGRDFSVCDLSWCPDRDGSSYAECMRGLDYRLLQSITVLFTPSAKRKGGFFLLIKIYHRYLVTALWQSEEISQKK